MIQKYKYEYNALFTLAVSNAIAYDNAISIYIYTYTYK